MYATETGINYDIDCNFPEAVHTHSIELHNTRAFNSVPRIMTLSESFIFTGDANITVGNSTIKI